MVCEEFSCTPLEALDQPYDLVMRMLNLRSYAKAKTLVDSAESQDAMPDTPMVRRVQGIQAEILLELQQRKGLGRS